MKTILLPSPLKSFLFALILIAGSSVLQQVYAQQAVLTSLPAATDNTASPSSAAFQTRAFAIEHTMKVKVIFEDLTGKGAIIHIRDAQGRILQKSNCAHKSSFIGKFDLSTLPNGAYTVEVIALTKKGLGNQNYLYHFNIESHTNRSISPLNKEIEKSLFTPKPYQVRR